MTEKTRYIPDFKLHRIDAEIIEYKDPKLLYFPTVDYRCPKGETCVVDGQYVKVGQHIGTRDGGFFKQPIYSTVSGKVVGVEKKLHCSGQLVDCLIVENDFKYELDERCVPRTDEEIAQLSREELIKIVEDSGLSGLGGSGFPTFIKYKTDKKIDVVLANGAECEPYITADYQIMMHKTERIIEGLIYAMKMAGAPRGVIAIKKKFPQLKETLEKAITKFPEADITVACTGNHYPAGWEIETIKEALKIKVPIGTLTSELGVIVSNVSSLYGIYRCIKRRMPMTERYFSINGDGISEEKSFNVRIGTPARDLIELCGGYKGDENKVIIVGGPMMGENLIDDDFIISSTATNLIILNEQQHFEEPCVSCASCVYSCPVDIQPVQIMNAYKQRNKDIIISLEVNKCIECGLCSYVCPSKIDLTNYMRQAKKFIK